MDRNRRGSLTQFQAGRTLGRGPREGGRLTGRRTKAAGEKAEPGSPGRWPIRKGGDLSGSGRVAEGGAIGQGRGPDQVCGGARLGSRYRGEAEVRGIAEQLDIINIVRKILNPVRSASPGGSDRPGPRHAGIGMTEGGKAADRGGEPNLPELPATERCAMKKEDERIALGCLPSAADPLLEIAQAGARRRLAMALPAQEDVLVAESDPDPSWPWGTTVRRPWTEAGQPSLDPTEILPLVPPASFRVPAPDAAVRLHGAGGRPRLR